MSCFHLGIGLYLVYRSLLLKCFFFSSSTVPCSWSSSQAALWQDCGLVVPWSSLVWDALWPGKQWILTDRSNDLAVALSEGAYSCVSPSNLDLPLLFPQPPFYSRNTAEMYDNILNKPLQLKPNITNSARHLLEGLLQKDRTKRLGAKEDFVSADWAVLPVHSRGRWLGHVTYVSWGLN